jgi:hypothetical protein
MGRPAIAEITRSAAGPGPQVQVDAIEVTQAVQDIGHSVPLIAGKRTFIRVYLGLASGAVSVRGELGVSRIQGGPWTTLSSVGTANLDASRRGSTPDKLRSRREDTAYSLDFRLPLRYTDAGDLWIRLLSVRESGTRRTAGVTDPVGTEQVTFVMSPSLRLRVVKLRYPLGTSPGVKATATDIDHLSSWLRRAYPVANVRLSVVTVDATATWPFTSYQANAQVAAIRALDMAGGADPGTHYYGIVSDAGGFMRGSAAGIPGTADPSVVASGPTGSNTWGWDNDGSYGDWYGGHEIGHTVGRLHPGFCDGQWNDDSAYPFAAGRLANANARFMGFDVGDASLGLPVVALPGTRWHDVMTYCERQWLSSYTYTAIRDRLVAEAAQFPEPSGPAGPVATPSAAGLSVSNPLVQVTGVVNLTARSASIEQVTPLPGPVEVSPVPADTRVSIRTRASDGTSRDHPVEFKPDLCRLAGEDEIGIVDAVLDIDPDTSTIELLLDGAALATFHIASPPSPPENVSVERAVTEAGTAEASGITVTGSTLSWDDPSAGAEGDNTYVVQASTDHGATWNTLAVGATRTRLELDSDDFAEAEQVRFRVLTTNGLTYREATTDDLPVDEL